MWYKWFMFGMAVCWYLFSIMTKNEFYGIQSTIWLVGFSVITAIERIKK